MTRRVLVTGATGLIGRMVIAPLVARGFEVVALGRSDDVPGATETITCDLLDAVSRRAAVKQADASHLLHLAWYGGPGNRWSAPENLDWAAATVQLVREFAAEGGTRAVGLGSCAEYDWSNSVLTEATALRPASLYGKAKAATGELLNDSATDIGISFAWARVFFCYGPGEPEGRLLGDLLKGLLRGEVVNCTDGLQERDFLHTGDVGRALGLILGSDVSGPVNVASGTAIPVRQLITTAGDLLGRSDLLQLGAIKRPATDPDLLVADISRLRALGFEPEFNLRAGLQNCIRAAGL